MEIIGNDELDVPEDPDHDQYIAAIKEFDACQDRFFDTTTNWTAKPFDTKHTSQFNNSTAALANALTNVAEVIVHDSQLTPDEKGHTLAAILLKADSDRSEFLSELAPTANIIKPRYSQSGLAAEIAEELEAATAGLELEDLDADGTVEIEGEIPEDIEDLEESEELTEIVTRLATSYALNFNTDITMFTQTVKAENSDSNFRKQLLKNIGGRILKAGEISIAVAVGVITAHQLAKKSSD